MVKVINFLSLTDFVGFKYYEENFLKCLINSSNDKVIFRIFSSKKYDLENKNGKIYLLTIPSSKGKSRVVKIWKYLMKWYYIKKRIKYGESLILNYSVLSVVDFYFLRKIKQKMRVKIIFIPHDILPREHERKPFQKKFLLKLYNLADKIVVTTEGKKLISSVCGECEEKALIIDHPIIERSVTSCSTDVVLEYKKNLKIENSYVFLFFGSLRRDKGIEKILNLLLMDRFRDLFRRKSIKIIFAGKDVDQVFSSKIDKLRNAQDIFILLNREISDYEKTLLFTVADVFLLPYEHSYSSGVFKEIIYIKKPMLCSKAEEFKEIMSKYRLGFMVDFENYSEIYNFFEEFPNNLNSIKYDDFDKVIKQIKEVNKEQFSKLFEALFE